MPTMAAVLKTKEEVIKEREGARVKRWLHILFGGRSFGFEWTNAATSYTDGKSVYAKYDIVCPGSGVPFTEEEKRVIRKATSAHERGHIEFDILEDYVQWLREHSSSSRVDWEANAKYPHDWTKFFGNVALDGRMEYLTAAEHPEVDEYFQFKNYNWKCAPMDPTGAVQDFRLLYMTRFLGMTDAPGLHPDSTQLIDSVQPILEQARYAASTKACLEHTLELVRQVWPILLEWLEADGLSPVENQFNFSDDAASATTSWGDRDEVEQNTTRVLIRIDGASAGEDGKDEKGDEEAEGEGEGTSTAGPDCSSALAAASKEAEKDEKEAEKEVAPYVATKMTINIESGGKRPAYSARASHKPYRRGQNLARYQATERLLKRDIDLTAKLLKDLCEPTPDDLLTNQRSGKVLVNRMWRNPALGESNFFARKVAGDPGAEVRIGLMADISGSTCSDYHTGSGRIIDEIRKALILMTAACEKATIPNAAYAFTEMYSDTEIYPLKPFGRFTAIEKGFLGAIEDESGNRDTVALQFIINEMQKYDEAIRLVVMISDGEPCFRGGEDQNTIRHMVQQAEKQGIDVLCLYCGPQIKSTLDMVRHMYPGGAINVGGSLTRELSKHVKRIIRRRK
ncbi:RNase P/RNase MRP subunit p29 [Paenibacillus mucilaginosus]|uniref:hypothetical protein n=1 Tax=Paenibacillus mucilaginosus TaxID=61624 RepID=UPI003D25A187